MSLRNRVRGILPKSFWQTAGFCKRIPAYWRIDRSEFLRVRNHMDGLPLFVTPDVCVEIPESLYAYINWKTHAFEDATSSTEVREFLDLAKHCTNFIDIGANTGFLSAVFSQSARLPARLVSVEPDSQVHFILERARTLNARDGVNWTISQLAISNGNGRLDLPVSNVVTEIINPSVQPGEMINVPTMTLAGFVGSLGWIPDLIKIDVESYEFEIVRSSLEFIETHRPALQLEVHWQFLAKRNLDGMSLLIPLHELGYRGTSIKYRGINQWKKAATREIVSRISLARR